MATVVTAELKLQEQERNVRNAVPEHIKLQKLNAECSHRYSYDTAASLLNVYFVQNVFSPANE